MNKSCTNIKVLAVGFIISVCLFMAGLAQATPPGDVTNPGDPIVGSSGNYPGGEAPPMVIDDNTGTKYLNFDKLNTGFTVTPALGGSRINGINIASANDADERDPASYVVSGSSDGGTTWHLIASGSVPRFSGRGAWQSFPFAVPPTAIYTSYRVIFPTVGDAGVANCMQVAEVELPGTAESVDTWAPAVVSAKCSSLTAMQVIFSESVDITGATFTLNLGGSVDAAALDGGDNVKVNLTVSSLIPGNIYDLTVSGVKDAAGNITPDTVVQVFADTGIRATDLMITDKAFSVNISGRNWGGNDPGPQLAAGEVAGVVPLANWNNAVTADNTGGSDNAISNIKDSSGTATIVSFRYHANDSWHSDGCEDTPDCKMMRGIAKVNSGQGEPVNFGFRELPGGTYHLFTYHTENGWWTDLKVNAGGTTYYFTEPGAFQRVFTRAQNTNPSLRDMGNYCRWDGLNVSEGGSLGFNMTWISGTDGCGINGCQIVPQPVGAQGRNLTSLRLLFYDPITDASADPANFILGGDAGIAAVTLSADYKSVQIDTVNPMVNGRTYWVTMSNIQKRSDSSAYVPNGTMVSFVAAGQSDIAVNFGGGWFWGVDPDFLNPSDVAGVEPVANWNNIPGVASGAQLNDVFGAPTPVTINFAADERWNSEVTSEGPNPGDRKLMRGYIGPANESNVRPMFMENVPYGLYKIIIYTLRDGSGEGEGFSVNGLPWLHVSSEGRDNWNPNPAYRRGTSTDPGARDLCNYVQFDDLYPINGTIKIDVRSESFRAPVNGIQLVVTELIPIELTLEPVDTTARENENFTMTCAFTGSGRKIIQWYMDCGAGAEEISGANFPTYTALATMALDGCMFSVRVDNEFSFDTSSNATLTVVPDDTKPRIVAFAGGPPADTLLAVTFSEPVTVASAEAIGNYTLTGPQGAVSVASLLADQKTVLLTIDPALAGGANYVLGVSGVQDLAFAPNTMDPTNIGFSTASVICTNGVVQREWYYDIGGGTAVSDLTNNAKWPNYPDAVDFTLTTMWSPQTSPDIGNYGASIKSTLTAPETGWYQFLINSDDSGLLWLSPTPREDQKQVIIWLNGCCRNEYSAPIYLVGGLAYYIQAIWKEGGGGDSMLVQWKRPTGGWENIPSSALALCGDNDIIAPTLVSVSASPAPNQIIVNFSEAMDDSTINPDEGSYATVTNQVGGVRTVIGAAMLSGNASVALELDGPIAAGETWTVTIGGAGVNDRSANHNHLAPDPSSATLTGLGTIAGVALKEKWNNLDGPNVLGTLTNDARYPCAPDEVSFITEVASPQTSPDQGSYGVRIRTYIVPPVDGNYQFRLRSDDSGRVLLGVDATVSETIVQQDGSCCNDSLFSRSIALRGGVAYYLEALMQEGGGGDYIEVYWKNGASIPDYVIIPAANIVYGVDPSTVTITINSDPVPADVFECRPATFTVSASVSCGGGGLTYQWLRTPGPGGPPTPIPGANGPSYTIVAQMGDLGALFSCEVCVPGKCVTSGSAELTVRLDEIPPTLVSVRADRTGTNVIVKFSENIDPVTALAPENYKVQDCSGRPHGSSPDGFPLGVSLKAPDTVVLHVDPLIPCECYRVVVNNVRDQCLRNSIDIDATTNFYAWCLMPYAATFDVYKYFGGTTIPDLLGHPSYPDSPAETYYIGNFDSRQAYIADLDGDPTHDNYGGRITAWFKAPVTGNYKFYAATDDDMQLSMQHDASGGTMVVVLAVPCCNGGFQDDRATADIPLTAGNLYPMEGLYKEGGGGDYLRIAVRVPGDTTATGDLLPIGPQFLWTMLDPDSIPTLPTAGMLAALPVRGFNNHIVQITNVFTNNTIELAEAVLAGTYPDEGANVARVPRFAETGIINYNVEANQQGRVRPDAQFRGIPGMSNSTDNFAMEVVTYVHLTAGYHAFGVNSDDNIRLSDGAFMLGEFNFPTGRGAADTVMRFYAPVEGLYPMRLVYAQGAGGGNVEWWKPEAGPVTIEPVNSATGIAAYRPVDLNPPVMTECPPDAVVECGVPVTWPMTAVDPEDGPVPVICIPPNGSTFPVGTTTVYCHALDAFTNASPWCVILVEATDTVPPVVTCPGNIVVDSCGSNGVAITFTATAVDVCAGSLIPVCDPRTGSTFLVGTTTVTCTATDPSGNAGTCNFTVQVRDGDLTPPVVTCPPDVVAECQGPNGAPVTYAPATATDNCDPTPGVVCVPPPGLFPIGNTVVTCTATDASTNSSTCTFNVRVIDTTAPVILDCTNVVVTCVITNTAVNYALPTAIDLCGFASVSCTPAPDMVFPCGDTTVACVATDAAGNSANCSFTVTVQCITRPALTYVVDGRILTLTWRKSPCYTLHTRADLGLVNLASDLLWAPYAGVITDDGTTCTAVIDMPTTGNQFYLLK